MQYCQYKESCRLQLNVSRHLNPFHPAYMHKKWCRKIDANRQWHGETPPIPTRGARGTMTMTGGVGGFSGLYHILPKGYG